MGYKDRYDVIVVGAGHAGCEAAHAAARILHAQVRARTQGAMCAQPHARPTGTEPRTRGDAPHVLLLTMDPAHVALMSCNPSVGGLAKGHLTREIDALGGLQALATDATGIQFRMLNTSKGPAVQAPRAQCDKLAYNAWMRDFMNAIPGLTVAAGTATGLILEPGENGRQRVGGIRVGGEDGREPERIFARAVVCATGTFLDGLIHIGLNHFPAGRLGERAAVGLGDAFKAAGLETGRLKTGTPPRLRAGSIDWSKFEEQPGDTPPPAFSFMTAGLDRPRVSCWLGHTNERTHEIIRGGLDRSPLYTGVIQGVGPRYCPSIEDKVVRFPHKTAHQVFLEPEGLATDWIYPSGLPTSLPEDVQEAMLRSIAGLENVEVIRPGYAVEYTYCPPMQLRPSLETKIIDGLFFGGQINGTSGYEEAAAQGLIAGINAALRVQGETPFVLGREEAYIGVLIDDLITMEHREPYRMFTSRAEYRLLLRHDNADLRLTPHGRRIGLVDGERWRAFEFYRERVEAIIEYTAQQTINPATVDAEKFAHLGLPVPEHAQPLSQYLARPEVTLTGACVAGFFGLPDDTPGNMENTQRANLYESLAPDFSPGLTDHPTPETVSTVSPISPDADGLTAHNFRRALDQALLHFKYDGYIRKQQVQVDRLRRLDDKALPEWLDYARVHGLRREALEKLLRFRPATIGQAGRIAGINSTDLALVLVHLKAGGV